MVPCVCVKGKGNPYVGRLVPCVHLKSGRPQQDGKREGGSQIQALVEHIIFRIAVSQLKVDLQIRN